MFHVAGESSMLMWPSLASIRQLCDSYAQIGFVDFVQTWLLRGGDNQIQHKPSRGRCTSEQTFTCLHTEYRIVSWQSSLMRYLSFNHQIRTKGNLLSSVHTKNLRTKIYITSIGSQEKQRNDLNEVFWAPVVHVDRAWKWVPKNNSHK